MSRATTFNVEGGGVSRNPKALMPEDRRQLTTPSSSADRASAHGLAAFNRLPRSTGRGVAPSAIAPRVRAVSCDRVVGRLHGSPSA